MTRERRPQPVARSLRVEARAKLNLSLAVGVRRADGFHDLVTVFQSVSLADTLMIEPRTRGFSLVVRHEDAALRPPDAARQSGGRAVTNGRGRGDVVGVPEGGENLVLRAAQLVARAVGLVAGARFTLIKRIPTGAGMGGGSADAAAVIAALPALYGLRMTRVERAAIALALGSDVPFALRGGTAVGEGRGERLTPVTLDAPFRAVVAVPAWRISTARAFARIDASNLSLTARGARIRSSQILGRKRLSVTSLMRLGNTFEEVLGERRSDFNSLVARLRRAGAVSVRMTGSGSAVFGVLGPDTPISDVVTRFTGNETLFVVRSTRSGMRRNAK